MYAYKAVIKLLPERIRREFLAADCDDAEEIRIRLGQAPSIIRRGREQAVEGEVVSERDILAVLERATGASLHAAADAMAQGYIDVQGLRIGVCGTVAANGNFRNFSSLSIRIPHAPQGICDQVIDSVFSDGLKNCLIISPPGFGKTTALREIIRVLSENGWRIGVIDERGEIAAFDGRRMQFQLGPCTDVLTGVIKSEGAMMLLRGMNVQMMAMDEITKAGDLEVIHEIAGCGVKLLATAHASSYDELLKRELYRDLLNTKVFEYIITVKYGDDGRLYEVMRVE